MRISAFVKFWLVESIPSPEPPAIRQMSSSPVIWVHQSGSTAATSRATKLKRCHLLSYVDDDSRRFETSGGTPIRANCRRNEYLFTVQTSSPDMGLDEDALDYHREDPPGKIEISTTKPTST
ncbi:hypothetical protein, partial [Halococcus thailandensis]|uniref:hypothetical protein n=1 Tax=Halococcus thailandensis TaxID=335952 RepID=UPI0019D37AD3